MTNIPATKTVEIDNYDNLILNLLSGFTVILIDIIQQLWVLKLKLPLIAELRLQ